MNQVSRMLTVVLVLAFAGTPAHAQEGDWPRTLPLEEGMVTIYQPQVEALDQGVLYYRAALAYRAKASSEPVFGAGWLKAPVVIDEESGVVHPRRLELTQARFPDGTADLQAEIATALLQQSMTWNLDFSVAELNAALDAAEAESLAAQNLKTAPPKIIYRDRPALLVTIDGDPVLREIENSPYQAVINTPFPLISDGDEYYLNAARDVWYRADKATGPYRFDGNTPKDIVQMVEASRAEAEAETTEPAEREPVTAANAPEIVVSTVPAELIVTEGPADFAPLVDDLLVLQNSDDDVFMHVGEQQYYIVLAGRWYRAPSLEGPWAYQASDDLPEAFAQIPDDSAQADSRVYVAGTPEAENAVLDAQVPQTAAVKREQVDIDVEYDGDPDFERVDGTEDLQYARNTGATVLESDRTYYLLEDGVWYVATSPHGPWVVSDHHPGELDAIEPSSPVYNTKYVRVYESTPEVVYVGYTPGYFGSYVYGPSIVYGTGWYYHPWVSPYYYYPRFSTWGFHVGYSDWGGWNFGLSWYWPYYSLNYYYGGYWHYGQPWYNPYWGYWGPRGYAYRPYYWGYPKYGRYGHKYYDHHDDNHYDRGYGKGRRYSDRHDKYAYNDRWDDNYDRERNRNLYRDDRQRAPVSQTRDAWRDHSGPRREMVQDQSFSDNPNARQRNAAPVRPADLQWKADVREINRAASREPMVATANGEVVARRSEPARPSVSGPLPKPSRSVDRTERQSWSSEPRVVESTPRQQSRTAPRSGEAVTRRSEPERPSVNGPLPQPSRSIDRSSRETATRSRQTDSPASQARSNSWAASTAPRQVEQRDSRQSRPSRQASAPPRQTTQRAPRSQAQPRVERQAPAPQARNTPDRRASASQWQPSRSAPVQQSRREPSRPERMASAPRQQPRNTPAPRAQQRSAPAPRPQQRSAPAPQPRNAPAPRPQQRSAPAPQPRNAPAPRPQQRNAPAPRAERGSPGRDRGNSRDRRRNN